MLEGGDSTVKIEMLTLEKQSLASQNDGTVTLVGPLPLASRRRRADSAPPHANRYAPQRFACAPRAESRYAESMKLPGLEQTLKVQLANELCAILHGYRRYVGAAHVDMHPSELSRLRRGDLRRFSLDRLLRYIARAGYDVEIHLKRTPRHEERPTPRRVPTSSVVRYDYWGQAV